MFTHPDPLGQLAAQHHRQMLAEARQRTLLHQHGRRSSRTPDIALRITRRLATAIASAGPVAAETPAAAWVARPQQPAGPSAALASHDRSARSARPVGTGEEAV